MAKILVTGGAGFVGYHLSKILAEDLGNTITILDNLSRGKVDHDFEELTSKDNVNFVKCDLTEKEVFAELDDDYDYVYHLAAIIGVQNVIDRPEKVLYVNTESTFNVLEFTRKLKVLKKFLISSTSEVYAGTLKHYGIEIPTSESVPLVLDDIATERTTYALSKIYGESATLIYGKKFNLPVTVVRYHNVYGPRMGFSHVIPEMFVKININSSVEVFSPAHTRAFCHISDAVEFTRRVAETDKSNGKTFHIGNSDEEISIKDLVIRIACIMAKDINIVEAADTPGSPERRCPDISRAVKLTGYKPVVRLDEGIRNTFEWYRDRL